MKGERHIIIGTAGHVDHGKTTLIRALTGINTDRLAEEQARGMTIDLGFAFLELPGDPPIHAGIVDVPGHEKFVKNMLAGAGGIDIALLVVSAEEGPMPQTKEHLDILTVLGVSVGVVALTKIDMADAELAEIAAETIRESLAKTPLADAPMVPVSAVTGQGMDTLKAALAEAAAQAPVRSPSGPFRLPVDRVFSLPGVGTVITGTLVSGTLNAGDPVLVQPQGIATRARTLQTHHRKIEAATPGMRVAVNLPGVEVVQVERGAVLTPPGAQIATSLMDARLSVLPEASRPLRHRERVRVHLGTGEVMARLLLLTERELPPGTADAPVQLDCEGVTAPARGERFVLRTYSPARAVGGGTVLEPSPTHRYRRGDEAAKALFEARGTGERTDMVYAMLAGKPADFSPAEVAAGTGLSEAAAIVELETLVDRQQAEVWTDGRYIADTTAKRLRETAVRTLSQYHRQNPFRKGMPRDGLRAPLTKAAAFRDFNAVLLWLMAEGVIAGEGVTVRLPEHSVEIPPGWRKPAEEILAVYRSAGLTPPSPENFQANYPRDVHVRTILSIHAENGDLIPLGEDLFIERQAYDTAKRTIRQLGSAGREITVATVRDATGSSRKVILPLLEHFDALKLTRRVGDVRVLIENG
ncbi:MAG: selenocysteine-specific translation elongation factor [Capsulimonadales bacterium]|nr:selenocysteine-specific translation elongation factor [Capsulimonadales bacterium]